MKINLIIFVLVIWAQDTYTKKYSQVLPGSKWSSENLLPKINSKKQGPSYLLMLKGLPRYPHLKDYTIIPNRSFMELKGSGKIRHHSKLKGKKGPSRPGPRPSHPDRNSETEEPPKLDVKIEVHISKDKENNSQEKV